MSKRLQVLLSDEEMESIRRQAKNQKLTAGEYVRWALREINGRQPLRSRAVKLALVRDAVKHSFPTGEIEQINEEVARGYRG